MNHPLEALFGGQPDEQENEAHALSEEAQRANLEAAWSHYSTVKTFRPGDIVRQRAGLGLLRKASVFLYVRSLRVSDTLDEMLIGDSISRTRFSKVDCIIAFSHDDGQTVFTPMDSDLLEPLEGSA